MGCSNSKSVSTSQEKRPKSESSSGDQVPKSVAFEVKFEDEAEQSEANGDKPQLPKRLQERLEESNQTHTVEEIEDKIQKATERRLQLMEDRLSKARHSVTSSSARTVSRAQEDSQDDAGTTRNDS